jgi:hypothetical protein
VPAEDFAEPRAAVTALWDATMCVDGPDRRV